MWSTRVTFIEHHSAPPLLECYGSAATIIRISRRCRATLRSLTLSPPPADPSAPSSSFPGLPGKSCVVLARYSDAIGVRWSGNALVVVDADDGLGAVNPVVVVIHNPVAGKSRGSTCGGGG